MTFGAPLWLWALTVLPVLIALIVVNERRRKTLLQKIVASRLQAQLAGSISHAKRRFRLALLLLGLASFVVSLARPQIGYTWEEGKHRGREVLIAIDTSKSMLSTDVAPNRLTRAKLAADDLVSMMQGDMVGLLAFAGESFLQAPLTLDYSAALDSIDDLDTNTIPMGGTNIASVINEAAKTFGKGDSENRCLILFTDGEELDADGVEAARSQAGNFRIFTVGVGTKEGSIIPISNADGGTDFVKDPDGQIVKSKLDENRLKQIAEATGGFYLHLENGPADMKKIVEDALGKVKQRDMDVRMSRHPIERYQWPLGLGLFLLAASMLISDRKRAAARAKNAKALRAAVALLAVGAGLQHAGAAPPPNEGIELYNNQKYKESFDAFNSQLQRNPDSQALEFDSGAAAFKAGDYDKAIDAFGRAIASPKLEVQGKSEYNLGNALGLRGIKQEAKESKLRDWNNAIQHYDEALKIDPKNEDAIYNRDVIKKLIDDLNKPPQDQKQQQDQKQDKDQKKDQKQDQKQNQKNQQNQQNKQDKQDQKDQQKNDQNSGKGQDNQQQQQQKQNQQQQQQQGQGQGSQDQNKQDSKDQNSPQKDQSNKDQNQQQGQQNKQDQNGQKGDNQPKDQQGQQGQNQQNPQPGQQNPTPDQGNRSSNSQQGSQQPTPADNGPDKKYSGQINAQQQQAKQAEQSQNAQREPVYVPGEKRDMTPEEARRIVESEKDEEAKAVLIEHKASAPVLKDW